MVNSITYEAFCVCFHNLPNREEDNDESCISLLFRISGFLICVFPFTFVADIIKYPSEIMNSL